MNRLDDTPGFWKIYPAVLAAMAGRFYVDQLKSVDNGKHIASMALKLTASALGVVEDLKNDDHTIIRGPCQRCASVKATSAVLGRVETQSESPGEE